MEQAMRVLGTDVSETLMVGITMIRILWQE